MLKEKGKEQRGTVQRWRRASSPNWREEKNNSMWGIRELKIAHSSNRHISSAQYRLKIRSVCR